MNTSLLTKVWLFGCLLCAASGAYVTRAYFPRVEFHTVTETKVNEVVHETTQTKIVYQPDGSRTVTTVKDSTKVAEKLAKKDLVKSNLSTEVAKTWHITGGVNIDSSFNRSYSLGVERRVFGPLFLGARVNFRDTVTSGGLTLGVEF